MSPTLPDRVRNLARYMDMIAAELAECGRADCKEHAEELHGAAAIAREWAEALGKPA